MLRILTDRGTEYCGKAEQYDYQLYLALNDIEALQHDLDAWIKYYNKERTHQGKMCCGRTPMEILHDGKQIWQDKFVN